MLAERRPDFLKSLFEIPEPESLFNEDQTINSQPIEDSHGINRIRLCLQGFWREITIDDFIPCFPYGEPIFARSLIPQHTWISLLEKAFAKVHGSYQALVGGSVYEALLDLTGCPTMNL